MLTAGVAVDKATLNFDKEFSYIVLIFSEYSLISVFASGTL